MRRQQPHGARPTFTPPVIAGLDPAIHHGEMSYWVYVLASAPGGTLYVGVTNDLVRRAYEHREGLVPGFTKRYRVKNLVYYEAHDTVMAAIQREKNIKHWSREWKIDLIVSMNPNWRDLYDEIVQ
jgi:putative endonuclease